MTNAPVPPSPQNQPAESPMMGLFLDRPAHMIDPKGFSACNNVRIELGRVRTDGIGWGPPANPQNFGASVFFQDSFNSFVNRAPIMMTYAGTDIFAIFQPGQNPTYATPCYNMGTVSVVSGTPTVTGVGTRWNTNYSYGSTSSPDTTTASAAAAGATSLVLAANGFWTCGNLVSIGGPINNPAFLPNGTFITGTSGSTITLSQPLTQAIGSGTTVVIGVNSNMRNNVRTGDYITFGNTTAGTLGGFNQRVWYQVASVASDTSLTLTTNYTGSTLSGSTYCIREIFSQPGTSAAPFPCSADTYLAAAGWNGQLTNVNGPTFAADGQCDAWYFTNSGGEGDPVYAFYVTPLAQTGSYVPTIPFFAGCLKQIRGIMVFGNLGAYDTNTNSAQALMNQIASSDDGFPAQMNTGVAFQGIATSGPFPISKLGILGANLMIYGTGYLGGAGANNPDSYSGVVTSASFVGYPTIWSFSDVVQTRGPVAGGAVAVFADRHQFLAIDGEYRYNGLFIQVMNDHVWRAVMKNFDYSRRNACFCFPVDKYGDLIWAVPLTTDSGAAGQGPAQTAFVEHYMEQANSYLFKPFTQRDFPFVTGTSYVGVGIDLGNVDNPIYYVGDRSGNLLQLYVSNLQNGAPALCTVTWASRKIGNGRARMLVTRVYPELEYQASPVSTVDVTLTLQNYAAGPVTITDTQDFDLSYGGGVGWTTHFRRGAVASVTLSDQAGVGWICDGYDWDYTAGGVRLKA